MKNLSLIIGLVLGLIPPSTVRAQPADSAIPGFPRTRLQNAVATSLTSTQVFFFDGGSFYDFVKELRSIYGTNALDLLEFPNEPLRFRVPKIRFAHTELDVRQPLSIYNSISEAGEWYLGKWIYLPANPFPNADPRLRTLVFLPPKMAAPGSTSAIAVKAFSISGISTTDRKNLQEVVEREAARLRDRIEVGGYGRQDPSEATGSMAVHESSGLLVATGGKTYVELVASVVEAFEKRQNIRH